MILVHVPIANNAFIEVSSRGKDRRSVAVWWQSPSAWLLFHQYEWLPRRSTSPGIWVYIVHLYWCSKQRFIQLFVRIPDLVILQQLTIHPDLLWVLGSKYILIPHRLQLTDFLSQHRIYYCSPQSTFALGLIQVSIQPAQETDLFPLHFI